jgi:hypothetical protein
MTYSEFFWLHIKKSAGLTTRFFLKPYYVEVNRAKQPPSFIQADHKEYNDILNNYRTLLGDYQFKRCQFAKQYLYPENWDNLYSFAFSREPIDRCLSMFYALYWPQGGLANFLKNRGRLVLHTKKLQFNTRYAFDVFLNLIDESQQSDSIYEPLGIRFSTHTAPMAKDITDEKGNILLKEIFRLEYLTEGINKVFEICGLEKRIEDQKRFINANQNRGDYYPSPEQRKKINQLFGDDFDIYENGTH